MREFGLHLWSETLEGIRRPWLVLWVWLIPLLSLLPLINHSHSPQELLRPLTLSVTDEDHSPVSRALLMQLNLHLQDSHLVSLSHGGEGDGADLELTIKVGFEHSLEGMLNTEPSYDRLVSGTTPTVVDQSASAVSRLVLTVHRAADSQRLLAALNIINAALTQFADQQSSSRWPTLQIDNKQKAANEAQSPLILSVWWVAAIGIVASLPIWVARRLGSMSQPVSISHFLAWLVARVLWVWLAVGLTLGLGSVSQTIMTGWLINVELVLKVGVWCGLSVFCLSVLSVGLARWFKSLESAQVVAIAWVVLAGLLAHPGVAHVNYLSEPVAQVSRWLPMSLLAGLLQGLSTPIEPEWTSILAFVSWLAAALCIGIKLIRVRD